jgi:FkbM family methyltransferase
MRSYAQQAEDVRLSRVFRDRTSGFYVDVGAGPPVDDSVTKHFYDLGWSGIDIEPSPAAAALLRSERPRDVVLEVSCSDHDGEATLYDTDVAGWSTIVPAMATHVESVRDTRITPRTVPVRTLASICAEHVEGPIDFLKVDVEGNEAAVLRGMDFQRWRPSVLILESTVPHTTRPSHEEWEQSVVESGYEFAAFDGTNRFYVAVEHRDFGALLAEPVTVLDEWESHKYMAACERVEHLERELADRERLLQEEVARRRDTEAKLQRRLESSLAAPAGLVAGVRAIAAATRRKARS